MGVSGGGQVCRQEGGRVGSKRPRVEEEWRKDEKGHLYFFLTGRKRGWKVCDSMLALSSKAGVADGKGGNVTIKSILVTLAGALSSQTGNSEAWSLI